MATRGEDETSPARLSHLLSMVNVDPANPKTWDDLGVALSNGLDAAHRTVVIQGVRYKPMDCFKIAAKIDPKYPSVWNNMGNCLIRPQDSVKIDGVDYKAKDCYGKALELDRRYTGAWVQLAARLGSDGSVYLRFGARRESFTGIDCLKEAIQQDPTDPYLWMECGILLHPEKEINIPGEGQPMNRQQCLLRALKLNPKLARAWRYLGIHLRLENERKLEEGRMSLPPQHTAGDGDNERPMCWCEMHRDGEAPHIFKGRLRDWDHQPSQRAVTTTSLVGTGLDGEHTVDYSPADLTHHAGTAAWFGGKAGTSVHVAGSSLSDSSGMWVKSTGGSTEAGAARRSEVTESIEAFLQRREPALARRAAQIAERYAHDEEKLIAMLKQRCGKTIELPEIVCRECRTLRKRLGSKGGKCRCCQLEGNTVTYQGMLYDSVSCFEEALGYDPWLIGAWIELGEALHGCRTATVKGVSYTAATCFKAAAERSLTKPSSFAPQAWMLFGSTLKNGEKVEVVPRKPKYDAQRCFEEALKQDPKHAAAWAHLGRVLDEANVANSSLIEYPGILEMLATTASLTSATTPTSGLNTSSSSSGHPAAKFFTRRTCLEKSLSLPTEKPNVLAWYCLADVLNADTEESILVHQKSYMKQDCYLQLLQLDPQLAHLTQCLQYCLEQGEVLPLGTNASMVFDEGMLIKRNVPL